MGALVDPGTICAVAVEHTRIRITALIVKRHFDHTRYQSRFAGIDRRAAGQQRVRHRQSAVILQLAE